MAIQQITGKKTSKAFAYRATIARARRNMALKRKLMEEYGVSETKDASGRRSFFCKDGVPPEILKKITSL